MEPVNNPQPAYRTLEEIHQRMDELEDKMQTDGKQFATIWNDIFIKRDEMSKGDYIAGFVSNSMMVIDLFLLFRKLKKNYSSLGNIFKRNR